MKSLQDFLNVLKQNNELLETYEELSTNLELTEIQKRLLLSGKQAMLCHNVINENGIKSQYPVLINLFCNKNRFSLGLNQNKDNIKELGELLAFLRQPKPPSSFKEAFSSLPILKRVMAMSSKQIKKAPSQEIIYKGKDVNLDILPIQTCWPNEPAPLITWGMVITLGPSYYKEDNSVEKDDTDDYNVGIYRMQKLSQNELVMRWLAHRGGAQQFARWKKSFPGKDMPIAVAIGADPALMLSAVIPVPDNLSEYRFAGLLRNEKTELVKAITNDMLVPAHAEIILEGMIKCDKLAPEGPYGDHTGYYNDVEDFPVFEIHAITTKKNPIYLSTYTSAPPDECSILGDCLNDLFVPIIKQQFPEIQDFYLLPEACSYRMAFVSIKKLYAGQAKRIMMGIWSYLRQFMYTKFIIIVDEDINIRDTNEVMWAVSTNVDPKRDSMIVENTPIDYLDFASPVSGLGSKIGIDATTKIYPETNRNWGRKIKMDNEILDIIDKKWKNIISDI